MKNKVNYQKELEKIIALKQKEAAVPQLLIHSCCAPCSSYCLEYLGEYFNITLLYYNPNISPREEYEKRVKEQQYFIEQINKKVKYPIRFVEGIYDPEHFYNTVKGFEKVPEGGERCYRCFRLRLLYAAVYAKEKNFDYFTTTLTISPLKNAAALNEIGQAIAQEYKVSFLPSDFKKKNGYKRSIELSKEYGLYRQDYCGCIFSKMEQMEIGRDN